MTTIKLKHSPYIKKTEFESDTRTKTMEKVETLNKYIWELDNEFKSIVGDINDDVKFIFEGRREDSDVLQRILDTIQDCNCTSEHSSSGKLEIHTIEKRMVNLMKKIKEDGILKHFDVDMEKMLNTLNIPTEIAVVASMSAGKSTLINSIMGKTLLPSKSSACTSLITKIEHDDTIENPKYYKDNQWEDFSLSDMEELHENSSEDLKEIHIKYDFNAVMSSKLSKKFIIVDTPGTNNGNTSLHTQITTDYIIGDNNIGMKPIIMFVFNIQSAGTETEHNQDILKKISTEIKKHTSNISDSFIFILNKADSQPEKQLVEIIKKLKQDLRDTYEIINPKLFVVSALNALTTREEEDDNIDIKHLIDYLNLEDNHKRKLLNLSKYATCLPDYQIDNLNKKLEKANDKEKVLYYSGIPAVELYIKDYIEKYDLPIKLTNIHSRLKIIIDDAFKKLDLAKNLLNKNGDYCEERAIKFKQELDDLKNKLDNANIVSTISNEIKQLQASHITDRVVEEISDFIVLSEDIFNNIANDIPEINKKHSTAESQQYLNNLEVKINDFEEELSYRCIEAQKKVSDWMNSYQGEHFLKAKESLKDLFGEKDYEKYNIGYVFELELELEVEKETKESISKNNMLKEESYERSGFFGKIRDLFGKQKYNAIDENLVKDEISKITNKPREIERDLRESMNNQIEAFKKILLARIEQTLKAVNERSLDFEERKNILNSKAEIESYKEELINILKGE